MQKSLSYSRKEVLSTAKAFGRGDGGQGVLRTYTVATWERGLGTEHSTGGIGEEGKSTWYSQSSYLSRTLGSAPSWSSSSRTFTLPSSAARCSVVRPS